MAFDINKLNVSPDDIEQLGTKEKFWFRSENDKWLFKYSRDNTGEHWSEKIAEQLCLRLGLPHAQYELAEMNGRPGVISRNLIPDMCRMIMGNEVLHKESYLTDPYPEPENKNPQFVRVREHTISRVLGCLDKANISPPPGWPSIDNLNAGDIFCGYLMLDALISNQDRHHENWAIVINIETQEKYLCETYDHAASLGRELTDKVRRERLTTRDKNRSIGQFVQKARSELFKLKTDKRPMLTIDAFFSSVEKRPNAKDEWLNRLKALSEIIISDIFNSVPEQVISDDARCFALQMVLENKKRLLTDVRI